MRGKRNYPAYDPRARRGSDALSLLPAVLLYASGSALEYLYYRDAGATISRGTRRSPKAGMAIVAFCRERLFRADLRSGLVSAAAARDRLDLRFARNSARHLHGRPVHRQHLVASAAALRSNPLQVYGALELGIAACAVLVQVGLPFLNRVYIAGAEHGMPGMLLRGILAAHLHAAADHPDGRIAADDRSRIGR